MINCPKCQKLFEPKTIWGSRKFCSRSCGNSRIRTDEFKKKARQFALANPKGWAANPNAHKKSGTENPTYKKWEKFRSSIICKECSKIFEVPYSKRDRKYCSVTCSNKNKYHVNSNRKKISIYKGYRMDSGAELLFAQQCDLLEIKWDKNTTESFDFVNSVGKQSKYYPDFYLEKYDIWVEIKGKRYIRPDDELRRAAVNKPVFLIISNDFEYYFNEFKKFINY